MESFGKESCNFRILLMWEYMPKCWEHGEKLFSEQSCTFASEKKENRFIGFLDLYRKV